MTAPIEPTASASRRDTAAYSARRFFLFVGRVRWVLRLIAIAAVLGALGLLVLR